MNLMVKKSGYHQKSSEDTERNGWPQGFAQEQLSKADDFCHGGLNADPQFEGYFLCCP